MSYLKFKADTSCPNPRIIYIHNEKDEYLGCLEYIRVGAWQSWCLTEVPDKKIYFSASCLDEIRAKMKSLNSPKSKGRFLDLVESL